MVPTCNINKQHEVKLCTEVGAVTAFPGYSLWKEGHEVVTQWPGLKSQQIDEYLMKNGITPFVDPEFPPNAAALGDRKNVIRGETAWYRARDMHEAGAPVKLFDKIEPSDMIQGGLGNCWLLAALSVVAEYPQFLPYRVFDVDDAQLDGKYTIHLWDYYREEEMEIVMSIGSLAFIMIFFALNLFSIPNYVSLQSFIEHAEKRVKDLSLGISPVFS